MKEEEGVKERRCVRLSQKITARLQPREGRGNDLKEQPAGVSSAHVPSSPCVNRIKVRKSRSMSLSATNSAISVRFSAEVGPTDWSLNNAVRSNLFSGVRQQESGREVTGTGTRLEMFDPDLLLVAG